MVRWVPLGRRRGLEYGSRCGGRSMVGWQWPLARWRHRYLSPEPNRHMMLLLEKMGEAALLDTCWMQSWRLVEFEQNHGKAHMLAAGWLVSHGRRAGQRFQAMRIDRPPKGGQKPPISPPHSPFFSFHLRQIDKYWHWRPRSKYSFLRVRILLYVRDLATFCWWKLRGIF